MPIEFPTNPSLNTEYTEGNTTWRWNGKAWEKVFNFVTRLNGLTGGLTLFGGTGISVFAGSKGITFVNTGVWSVNGLTGNVTISSGVTGPTGATGPQGPTGPSGIVGNYVSTWNGLTGDVTGVTSTESYNWSQIQYFDAGFEAASSVLYSIDGAATALTINVDSNNTAKPLQIFNAATIPETEVFTVGATGGVNATSLSLSGILSLSSGQGITQAVTSVNGITGPVTLSAGYGITLSQTGKTVTVSAPTEDSISIVVEGTPDDISTGNKGFRLIPYNCTPLEWYIVAGQTGSIQFDIKSSSFANYPNTTSIVGANYPGLSGAMKNSNTGITGWGGLTSGDIVDFVINSNTGIQKVGLFIKIRRNT